MLAVDKTKLEESLVYSPKLNQIKFSEGMISETFDSDYRPLKISKYAREGVTIYDRFQMIKQYIDSPFGDSLKIVLYGVDQYAFNEKGLSSHSYKLFYPFMDQNVIDLYIKINAENSRDYWGHKLFRLSRYTDALINSSIRGWMNDYSNYKYGEINVDEFRRIMESDSIINNFKRYIELNENLVETFYNTMATLKSKKIKVILFNPPTIDILNKTEQEKYEKIMDFFSNFAKENDYVEFWNMDPQFASEYSIFFDPIHLNPKGQQLITSEVIKKMNNMKLE
jgi:hypothetical protein